MWLEKETVFKILIALSGLHYFTGTTHRLMQRNDILWKGLIEEIFPYFIPFFLPQYVSLFDLTQPVAFLDKELQQLFPQDDDEMQHPRFVDKLVRVYTTEGTEQWVLIHIEVQGQREEDFARRMFRYFYRLLDRYGVAITAIVILTDDSPGFIPAEYVYAFAGTRFTYQFNTYKVLQQDEQQLGESDNPFAIAVLTVLLALKRKKLPDESLLNLKVNLYRQLRSRNFSEALTRRLFTFLDLYVHFDKPELRRKFEVQIQAITGKTETMGLIEIAKEVLVNYGKEEGREQGREQEKEERNTVFVTNLLNTDKFSDEEIASLADVSLAFVQQIRQAIKK